MYNQKPKINLSIEELVVQKSDQIIDLFNGYDKIAIECYPGTDYGQLKLKLLNKFPNYQLICIDNYATKELNPKIEEELTNDRVFGVMKNYSIEQFYQLERIPSSIEKVIYYGFGASLLSHDLLIYIDLARWEIQKRFRKGYSNWNIENSNEDILKKFKRGFFFEWRMADSLKKSCFNEIDYFIDLTNLDENLKLIKANYIRDGLLKICNQPFRLVPFFDPSVWGGKWMEQNLELEPKELNYGWSFDGVPEENSILLEFGTTTIELPAMTLVKFLPKKLLGPKTYHRFGDEFPIRFDFLDTVEGENLSLQVHPLVEYIKSQFNMSYTQDESYYILDTDPNTEPAVYLGFKTGIDSEQFLVDLTRASTGECEFDAEKYVNKVPVKKGDHLLIPAGTIHCSGAGTMVLEISATPYIFTFKLWDWGRLGLDGLPRPTHIEHGKQVLNFECTTDYVYDELVNNFEQISDRETKTGLHPTQFIETRRFESENIIMHQTQGEFQMLNLVEGNKIIISSPDNKFMDYEVNFAETVIIPAGVSKYTITPVNGNVTYIKAYVRF